VAEPERQVLLRVVLSLILVLFAGALPPITLAAEATPHGGGPMPMTFEPNQGQADAAVKFLARGRGYGLFLTPTETVLVLAPAEPGRVRRPQVVAPGAEPVVVRMRLVGADPEATIVGVDPLPGRSHYILGESDRWRRSVPSFARVQYTGVYPGVSLVFYGSERQLEYDFVVAPGADPAAVALAFDGAHGVRLDGDGDLVLATSAGELRLRRPVIYQEADGERRPVEGGYVLDGDRVRFRVAVWDASRPLVIDPVLGYSTFLGGSSNDQGFGIAVDSAGNAYVTGSTISSNFPVSSAPLQATRAGVTDAFVTKLSPGGTLLYSTFLGGSGDDAGNAIAVDDAGNVYVVGTTNSTTFPVLGAFQSTLRGGNDAFVAKLDPSGSTLVYSTYLGSNTDDTGNGIALDSAGNAYVTGSTASAGFPNNNAVACLGTKSTGDDAFVVMLNTTGATVGYCRFIGGSGVDAGQGIAADAAGNVWFVGTTTSSNLPVVAAVQPTFGGGSDGFVGKLDPTGAVVYLTYLGGSGFDLAFAVAVDVAGNAYVTGSTDSIDFPMAAPLQPVLGGGDDAFVTKLNVAGTLVFSTYLGGSGDDAGNGIAVHPGDSSVFVAGSTKSLDFPVVSPIQPALAGRLDAFVARLNPAGSALVFSTYLGGAGDDVAQAIAVDGDGVAYLTGSTNSAAFPTATPIQNAAGLLDAFVTQIAEAGVIQFTVSGYQVSENGGSATITVQRAGDTSGSATVQFATSNGTATAGADYTATSGTLTFVPGQITKTFTVAILPDAICDGDETVNLTLSNPGGGSVLGTRRTATLTILDPAACITFGAVTYNVLESHSPAQITVARSGPAAGQVTVQFATSNGTATAPADYTTVNRTLTFAPGVRLVTVSIPIVNDTIIEGQETVNLALSNVQGAAVLGSERTTATLFIDDDDLGGAIQFSAAAYTVSEGSAVATITLVRTGGVAGPVTVDFATQDGVGTATAGADYTSVPATTVTFAAGVTTRTVTVPIVNDTLDEPNETIRLLLTNPGGGATLGPRSTAVLTIVDNDVPTLVQFSQALYTVNESAASATITITRSGGLASTVTVDFATSDGPAPTGATAGSDYTATTVLPVTFLAGQVTRTVVVPLLGDAAAEGNEFVALTLSNPGGGAALGPRSTAQLKILDDEASVQFAAAAYSVTEGAAASITVERTGTAGTVIVPFATSNGTGIAGTDYVTRTGSLTFTAGVKTLAFSVPTITNTVDEGNRTVNLTLGPAVTGTGGAILGPQNIAVLTIVDNDVAGQIRFSAATYTVSEATAVATITLIRSGGLAGPVTVDFATGVGTATAGTDYTAVAQTITFAAGVTTRTVTIPILNDTLDEPNETIPLQLTNPGGGATLGLAAAVLTIVDNDVAGTVQFSQALYTVSEAAASATIVVTRSGGAASAVTVDFATSNGPAPTGATAGSDYTATAVTLTFAANQVTQNVVVLLPANDATAEGNEFVTLTLSNPGGGAALGPRSTAQLKILDDEASVQFAAAAYSVTEGAAASITVERTGTAGTVIVPFATSNGTGIAGTDYVTRTGSLTFTAGVKTLAFSVPTITNTVDEGNRTVNLSLGPAVTGTGGAILGPQNTAVLTIVDNDVAGQIQFSAATYTVSEATAVATITLIRSGGLAGPVTVDFATLDGAGTATAGADYTAVPTTTVTFGAGVTTRTVTVPILNDTLDEPNETVVLTLTNPGGGATLGPRNTAILTIVDND
jgi:Calx-beta domain/Beta-propeller repeat